LSIAPEQSQPPPPPDGPPGRAEPINILTLSRQPIIIWSFPPHEIGSCSEIAVAKLIAQIKVTIRTTKNRKNCDILPPINECGLLGLSWKNICYP
jgi:hypothetical protein